MFGLTKREQRWKAEQQAAELLVGLAQVAVRAAADVRVAEANSELEWLRKENAELRAAATPHGVKVGPPMNPWQAAVDDALVCHALDCTGPDSDPVECVSRLIRVAVDMALDPAISERAQALIDRGAAGVSVDAGKTDRGQTLMEGNKG